MTQVNQVYKCAICGNIVEVLHNGAGELVCCGQPMNLLAEKKEDAGAEKHVPVIESTPEGSLIKIGSIPHPMDEAHHIEWIEVQTADRTCRKYLKPGDAPEALFRGITEVAGARCYCNLHGLWKA